MVLVNDDACEAGALKVKDIPEGAKPKLPRTWPGLPILIDSPDYRPALDASTVEVRVPQAALGEIGGAKFDGVTAGLRSTRACMPRSCAWPTCSTSRAAT